MGRGVCWKGSRLGDGIDAWSPLIGNILVHHGRRRKEYSQAYSSKEEGRRK